MQTKYSRCAESRNITSSRSSVPQGQGVHSAQKAPGTAGVSVGLNTSSFGAGSSSVFTSLFTSLPNTISLKETPTPESGGWGIDFEGVEAKSFTATGSALSSLPSTYSWLGFPARWWCTAVSGGTECSGNARIGGCGWSGCFRCSNSRTEERRSCSSFSLGSFAQIESAL
jgi:hypothetical protein